MAAAEVDLGDFEGHPIAATTIALRNAGDGLSKATKVDPVILHHGQRVFVVYEASVFDIQHPEIKDSNEVTRKQILRAGTAKVVLPESASGKRIAVDINQQAAAVAAMIEAEKPVATAPLDLDFDPLGVGVRASDEDEPPRGQRATRARKPKAPKAATPGPRKPRKATAKKGGGHLSSVPT